jgi:hypothetical protein
LRRFLWAGLLLAVSASGYGQGWAVPATTPDTPVPCTGCPNVDPNSLTVGYKAPIVTFTGRYLDSSNTSEWFRPFRTARAKFVLSMPALDRIYFRYGDGSIASYKLSTFFTRLESGEPLVYAIAPIGAEIRSGNPEVWLRWDTWFNPEISVWQTVNIDGSLRMTFFDVDDLGYVYVASTIYGWGIVKDDFTTFGVTMRSMVQKFPSARGDSAPSMIAVVKGATRYYAILGRLDMWDATNRENPVKLATTNVPGLKHFAKNAAGDRIAIIDDFGNLVINTGDGFASGTLPLFNGGGYGDVTSDGTNFFALKYPAGIVVLVPSGDGYVEQPGTSVDPTFSPGTLKYGDGYLVSAGADIGGSWDARVFKVGPDLVPTPLVINAGPGDSQYPSFFRNYYGVSPNVNYVTPGYINMLDGTVVQSAGKTYLIICAKGIGDVYRLPDPIPVLPPTNVTATPIDSTSVHISWTADAGAASYHVYRGERSGGGIAYTLVGSPTTDPWFDDMPVSPNKAYLYKVRSFAGSESADSNVDLATTVVFTDRTLTPLVTTIKSAHFTELLTAVNAVRTLAGLGAIAFTAPEPSPGVTVLGQHVIDLRVGLDSARSTLGLNALSYSDPTIAAGTTIIKPAHITELRNGVN